MSKNQISAVVFKAGNLYTYVNAKSIKKTFDLAMYISFIVWKEKRKYFSSNPFEKSLHLWCSVAVSKPIKMHVFMFIKIISVIVVKFTGTRLQDINKNVE